MNNKLSKLKFASALRAAMLALASGALAACGGGSSAPSAPVAVQAHTLGGTVTVSSPSGVSLSAQGLVLANGSTTLTIGSATSSFTFPGTLPSGTAYAITVQSSPTGLTCTVAGGSGTISANVANIVVTCSDNAYRLGGTIALASGSSSGASVTGLVLANGSDTVNVPSGASSFTMPTTVAYGSSYQVSVRTQPQGMSCAVSPATARTMPASHVTNVTVTCSDQPYTLSGTVTINAPTGLTLSDQGLVLTNSANGDTYTFTTSAASFTMSTPVLYGAAYALTVTTQPTGLSCAASNPSGTMPAGNVTLGVTCSDQSYALGGNVTISAPSGVTLSDQNLALTNTGNGDTYSFTSDASSFTMTTQVPYGAAYALAVTTQPSGLSCTVAGGSGTMPASAVTSVAVTCADQSYTLGGSITGLGSASGLVLTNEGADATTILANATIFTMNTAVPYGAAYSVAVQNCPVAMSCSVTQGSGTMPAAAVTNVEVACAPRAESVLWSFGSSGDGKSPYGSSLIQGSDGNFYGMTTGGGANGNGAVIKITSAGAESVLYSFGSSGDGASPEGSLIQGSDGNFYGMTTLGGAHNGGAVIKITPAGAESLLWSFGSSGDGAYPNGSSLIQGSDGNFYGMTAGGGANGGGAVIKITPAGAESVLWSFGSSGDGASPIGGSLIQGSDGNFYGMTYWGPANGPGAIIKITPAGAESVLWSFGGTGDGAYPFSNSLIQGSDGNFYGMTTSGGANGKGAVIKITPSGAESVLWSFGSSGDGVYPQGSLIQGSDGTFYGMTTGGGALGPGAVIKITPAGAESVLWSFGSSGDGASPFFGSLVQGSDGHLYGMTYGGGANGVGVVFKIN